jgi:hypothetical protein
MATRPPISSDTIYSPAVLGFTKVRERLGDEGAPFDACGYFQGAHADFTAIVLGQLAEDDAMDEQDDLIPCPECGGTGKVPLALDNLPGPIPPSEIGCPICGGTGFVRPVTPKRQD